MARFKVHYTTPKGKRDCKVVSVKVPSKYTQNPGYWVMQEFCKRVKHADVRVDHIEEV